MGASKEKKKRLEAKENNTVKVNQREVDAAKRNKKFITIAIIVVVVLAICIAIVAIFKSPAFFRNTTALEIEGEKYSIAEYNYFYNAQKNNYESMFGDQLNEYMTSDDIKRVTLDEMKRVTMYYKAGIEAGLTLTEDDALYVDTLMNNYKSYSMIGKVSLDNYLQQMFGKGVNEEVLRKRIEAEQIVDKFMEWKYDSFEYTDDEIANLYNNDEDDNINYRIFTFSVSANAEDPETEFELYKKQAKDFADRVTDEASFAEIACEYATESMMSIYLTDEGTTFKSTRISYLDEDYVDWLTDSSRKEGDVTVIETDDNKCHVLYFVSRDANDYNVASVRMLPVHAEELVYTDYASNDEFMDAFAEKLKSAENTAHEILDQWATGDDPSAENFKTYAKAYGDEYSDDGAGLYENLYRNKFNDAMDEWIFDSSRKPGDTTIIRDGSIYYVIYFNELKDMTYAEYLADSELRDADFDAWEDESLEDVYYKETWALSLGL